MAHWNAGEFFKIHVLSKYGFFNKLVYKPIILIKSWSSAKKIILTKLAT